MKLKSHIFISSASDTISSNPTPSYTYVNGYPIAIKLRIIESTDLLSLDLKKKFNFHKAYNQFPYQK